MNNRKALEAAHAQIRDLRNQLETAAQPLRLLLREAEDKLTKALAEGARQQERIAHLEAQVRVQQNLIDATASYHAWRVSSGKAG